MRRRVHSATLLLAAWLCAPLARAAPLLEDLTLARDLICTFHKSGPVTVPPPLQLPGR